LVGCPLNVYLGLGQDSTESGGPSTSDTIAPVDLVPEYPDMSEEAKLFLCETAVGSTAIKIKGYNEYWTWMSQQADLRTAIRTIRGEEVTKEPFKCPT